MWIGRFGAIVCCALACCAWTARATAAGRFADSPCLLQTGAAATQACEKLAQDVSHDIEAARALGDELERSGRYDDAAKTYQIALTVHPDHRNLLQRLIRARGQSRSLRMLSGSTATALTVAVAPPPASATPPAAARATAAAVVAPP